MKTDIGTYFRNGRRARTESPLPFGLYKLIEVRRNPERVIDTLNGLMKAKRYKQSFSRVLFGESPQTWARGWLKELAYRAGKDLLPSIEALTGDGMSADVIQQNLSLLRTKESELLATIERADWEIKSWRIGYEYQRWMRGDSAMIEPCVKFLEITEVGLRLVDKHLPDRLSARDR